MSWKLVDRPKAKALLYYPKLWEPQWPMWAPLDVFAIAASLLHAGWEVIFLDERIDPDPRHWLSVALPHVEFVGFSGKFGEQCRHMVDAARFVKRVRPDVPVVAGGWFPSLHPEATLGCEAIDYVIQGPGDFNMPELADRLLARTSVDGIAGVWRKEGGRIVGTHYGHLPPLEKTKQIPWDVVNLKRYVHPNGWINYFSSRGCPGGCTFCSIYCLDPHRWTALPVKRVVDDWEWMTKNIGATSFKVMDTDYCADQKRVDAISDEVLRRGLKIRFEVLARHWNMRRMTDAQIAKLRRAGCTEIEVGIESGSQRLADLIDKQVQIEEVVPVLRRFAEAGIRIKTNIMFGIATETAADLADTLRLLREIKAIGDDAIRLQLFRYTPLPDAPLSKKVWATPQRGHDGRIPETLDELLALPINDEPTPMFWLPERYEKTLRRVYDFYAPLAFYRNSLDGARGRPIWRRVLALFKSMARWRARHGFFELPIEKWLNDRIGGPIPRGEDFGITSFDDALPARRYMGDTVDDTEPLPVPEPAAAAAAVELETFTRKPDDAVIRHSWLQ